MHKINRIGSAIATESGREATTPACFWTGSSSSVNDVTAQTLSVLNGDIEGITLEGVATGSFTMTTATAFAYGQQLQIDIPFGDSIAIEAWGFIQVLTPTNAIWTPIAGHTAALNNNVANAITVSDVIPLKDPDVASTSSTTVIQRWLRYHSTFIARRVSAAPFVLFHGWKGINPGADSASNNVRCFSFGYRTLADQFAHTYYDPAR